MKLVNEPRHILVWHLIRRKLEEAQARYGGEIHLRHGIYWLWIPKSSPALKAEARRAQYKLHGRKNSMRPDEIEGGRREPDYLAMSLPELLRTENDPDRVWRGAVGLSDRLTHNAVWKSDNREMTAVEKEVLAMIDLFPSIEDLLTAPENPEQVTEMNLHREVAEWQERRKLSARSIERIVSQRKPRRRRVYVAA